jgi:GAF domain-containing protein
VLRIAAESGVAGEEFRNVTQAATFREGVGVPGRAWRQRDVVFVADLAEVTDCVRAPAARRAGIRSGVCFPVLVDGAVVGTMDFFTTEALELSRERIEALRSVSRTVSGAVQRLRVADEIRDTARSLAAAATQFGDIADNLGLRAETTSQQAVGAADASEEVSANIGQLAAGAEQMTASIREIARSASEAAQIASEAVAVCRRRRTTPWCRSGARARRSARSSRPSPRSPSRRTSSPSTPPSRRRARGRPARGSPWSPPR